MCKRGSVKWVGIHGPTGAGKTALAHALATVWGATTLVVGLDCFYRSFDRQISDPLAYNFDCPAATDWDVLLDFINGLTRTGSALLPRFDYSTGLRQAGSIVQADSIVIIEGLWLFCNEDVMRNMDLKIYIDAPSDLRLIRRLRRDVLSGSRGWEIDAALNYFEKYVRPSEPMYIASGRGLADIIIDGTANMERNVDSVLQAWCSKKLEM